MKKCLSINGPESEVIPSSDLILMLTRIAGEERKSEIPAGEGRVMRTIGKALLIIAGLFFGIHMLAWWLK